MERKVKFQYFKITYCQLNKGRYEHKGGFNLADWVINFEKQGKMNKLIGYEDGSARVEKFDLEDDYYIIRFIKKRFSAPSKCKEGEEAEPIPLDDDEYIGEDVTLLYDREKNIVMLQSNRFAMSYNSISRFISNDLNKKKDKDNKKIKVFLKPLIKDHSELNFKDKIVRTLEVSFANINTNIAHRRAVRRLLSGLGAYHGLSGRISISVGRSKTDALNNEEVHNLIKEVVEEKQGIERVTVKYKDDEDSATQILDLFDDVRNDIIYIKQEENKPLDYDNIKQKMIAIYNPQ